MEFLRDFLSPAAGQRRTKKLNDTLEYYTPPAMRQVLGLAGEANPVQGVYQSGADMRDGDYVGAATNMAAALMPVAGAVAAKPLAKGIAQGTQNATDAITDALTMYQAGGANAARQFATDESGAVGPYTTTGEGYFEPFNPNAGRSKDPARYTDYSTTKHVKDPSTFSTTGESLGNLLEPKLVSPSDIQGREMFFATGDRTARDRNVHSVGDLYLPEPVRLEGGPRYMDDPTTGAWASDIMALKPKSNVFNAYDRAEDPILAALPMGERSGDFSKHMSDVYVGMMNAKRGSNSSPMDTQAITSFLSNKLASGKDRIPDEEILASMPEFGTPQFGDWLKGLKGTNRAKVLKALDQSPAKQAGAPDIAEARFAITEPELVDADVMSVGYRMATPDTKAPMVEAAHPSYSHDLPAKAGTESMTLGDILPFSIGAGDVAREKLLPGQYGALPKDIKSLMGNPKIRQKLDQRWVDEASRYQELLRSQGKQAADGYARSLMEGHWSK